MIPMVIKHGGNLLGWYHMRTITCILWLEGTCWVDMTLSWIKNGKKHGGLLHCAYYGLLGRKWTKGFLMMLSSPIKQLSLL